VEAFVKILIGIEGIMARRKIPQGIGSSWIGKGYVHGPRKVDPRKCSEIRLGKSTKEGIRLVWCKLKGTDKWVVQSKLTPIKKATGKVSGKRYLGWLR